MTKNILNGETNQAISVDVTSVIHQTAELVSLIHELSAIRQQMLDLEALGLQKSVHIHPTYLQSARNLFHYLALRRHEIRPIQERLSALGLSSLGRTESHVLTSVNKVMEALHRLAQIPVPECIAPAPINSFEEGRISPNRTLLWNLSLSAKEDSRRTPI
jgi:hypothetical protein